VVPLGVLVAAVLLAGAGAEGNRPARLPSLGLHDQHGRRLELDELRGQIVVLVYGTRARVDEHVAWGRRLDAAVRERGAAAPPGPRSVRILAIAQMGGVPTVLRPLVRAAVRDRIPADFSLWLDWEDEMSTRFGVEPEQSTVVVGDRHGRVRLVTAGPPTEAALEQVLEVVLGLP
jgi:hypothetical protein